MNSAAVGEATPFRCPACHKALRLADDGQLQTCSACGWVAADGHGAVLNFVLNPALKDEAAHFGHEYESDDLAPPVELESLGQLWRNNPWAPFNETMLEAVGDVDGKIMLLLGNGVATKELYFLTQGPRALVFSDLSTVAVRAVRDHYPEVAHRDDVFFAAIDAQQIPFADSSVDVVFGYAFVHHLPDLDRFFAEIARILEPGGRAVFMDNSYSPLWQRAKLGWLNPLMRKSHEIDPISEEDVRYTLAGGFREDDLQTRARVAGLEAWFEPTGTVHYLGTRVSQIFGERFPVLKLDRRTWALSSSGRHELVIGRRWLLNVLRRADSWVERFGPVRENRMRLIWGLTKPGGSGLARGARTRSRPDDR